MVRKEDLIILTGFFILCGILIFVAAESGNSCTVSAPFLCTDVSALGNLDVISISIKNGGSQDFLIQEIYIEGCNEGNLTQNVFPDWLEVSGQDSYSIYCDSDVLDAGVVFSADVEITFNSNSSNLTQVATGLITVIPIGEPSSSSSSSSSGSSSSSSSGGGSGVANYCFPANDLRSSAVVLHRKHVSCNDDSLYEPAMKGLKEQNIVINSDKRQYCNVMCKNRKQEQCYNDGSFDTYYMEWCEDGFGNRINIDGADNWADYGYDCYSDVDCPYGQFCNQGYCLLENENQPVECYYDSDCPEGYVCNSNKICIEYPFECEDDSDCSVNHVCIEGYCLYDIPDPHHCGETDGGKNYYLKGVSEGYNSYTEQSLVLGDYCYGGNMLVENYCEDDNLVTDFSFKCPNGCKDGACIGEGNKEIVCKDSDSTWAESTTGGGTFNPPGKDRYNKGKVSFLDLSYEDYCVNVKEYVDDYGNSVLKYEKVDEGTHIQEFACINENSVYMTTLFECPNGCKDGACVQDEVPIKKCEDSDSGLNYYQKGKIKINGEEIVAEDYCIEKSYFAAAVISGMPIIEEQTEDVVEEIPSLVKGTLVEYYCYIDDDGNEDVLSQKYVCKYGCENGACKKGGVVIEPTCENGCVMDGKCYAYGYRKEGKYCSDENKFVYQKVEEMSCDNDFECDSNVCVSGQCISQGLIQKIISWFRNIFG